jgi:hypothetical protein
MADHETEPVSETKRTYTWPWWVLGAVLLAIALAILWMSYEIARTRMIRDLNAPVPQKNRVSPRTPAASVRRDRRSLRQARGEAG